jgi:hypothetical protein
VTRSTPTLPWASPAGNYGRVRYYLGLGHSFNHSSMAAFRVLDRDKPLNAVLSDPGRLKGESLARWLQDAQNVVYVVWSYRTPVWWVTWDGTVYAAVDVGGQTTAKHRNLALAWAWVPTPEETL